MPRIEHEPWCQDHGGDVGLVGSCLTGDFNFGPKPERPDVLPDPVGTVSGGRIDRDDVHIYVDYRTTAGGQMDVNALRAVREAVAESPAKFLDALDKLIEVLGPDVPPAHSGLGGCGLIADRCSPTSGPIAQSGPGQLASRA